MRTEDTTAQRVNEILLKRIHQIAEIALCGHVILRPENNAKQGCVTKITLTFILPEEKSVCIQIVLYNDEGDGCNMRIGCTHENTTIYLGHLSVRNGAEYTKIAKAAGIPAPLDEAARMTEFCVALITPLFTQHALENYVERLDTVERDGILYYAGYGGMMRALFPPSYSKTDSFEIAHVYGSNDSD